MSEQVWLAIVSVLIGLIGVLLAFGYYDFRSRVRVLERRQKMVIAALMEHALTGDKAALLTAVQALITNGAGK